MVEDKKILNDEAVEAVSGGGANGPSWYENGCTYYRVVARDTLSEIAVRFGTNAYAIQRLNPELIKNIDFIREGWVIRVL